MRVRGKLYKNNKIITKDDILFGECIKECGFGMFIYSNYKLGKMYLKKINNLKLNELYVLDFETTDKYISNYLDRQILKAKLIEYIDNESIFYNKGYYFTYNNKYYKYVITHGQGTMNSIQRIENKSDIKYTKI